MKKLAKKDIYIFGEASFSEVVPYKDTYLVIRQCDGRILAIGKELKGYLGDIIRTMYTGYTKDEGDYILWSADKQHMICKFK